MLYRAIGSAIVSGERFYWIRSLASPDAWLTVIVLALTAASAWFAPGMSDTARRTLIAVQLGITFFFVWKLAAGYGLYWASSSLLGLGQTLWLRHERVRVAA
jgi:YidC/Oxa1 family membrane protein insertase